MEKKANEIFEKANIEEINEKQNEKDVLETTKNKVLKIIDQNNNGQIDIEDFIILALKTPGIRVDRKEFLNKEFSRKYSNEIVNNILENNPMHANIPPKEIDHIAEETIKYERNFVSGIAAVLGAPGGFVAIASAPVDLVQYYAYTIRTAQKLMYLYGFPEIISDDGVELDAGTMNLLILCLGSMYSVAGANVAIAALATGLGKGMKKQLMKKALTKGTVYPIIKNVAKWFGIKVTKDILTDFIEKALPVIGGVIGGGITFFSFGPCCRRFQTALKDTNLSNPNHVASSEEIKIVKSFKE